MITQERKRLAKIYHSSLLYPVGLDVLRLSWSCLSFITSEKLKGRQQSKVVFRGNMEKFFSFCRIDLEWWQLSGKLLVGAQQPHTTGKYSRFYRRSSPLLLLCVLNNKVMLVVMFVLKSGHDMFSIQKCKHCSEFYSLITLLFKFTMVYFVHFCRSMVPLWGPSAYSTAPYWPFTSAWRRALLWFATAPNRRQPRPRAHYTCKI